MNLFLAQVTNSGVLMGASLFFFIGAIITYVLGNYGVMGLTAHTGRVLLFLFLVLSIVFVIVGLVNRV